MNFTGLKVVMRATSSEDTLDIDLLNEIYHDANEAWWMGGTTAQDFADKLSGKNPKQINVRINSNGGVVSDGVAMFNLLREKSAQGAQINVTVLGMAASAATIVAMAGDKRKMATGSRMMIHSAGIAGRIPFSNASELRKYADQLEQVDQTIADIYSKRSGAGKTKDEFLALMAAETYLSADDAIAHGLATETDPELQAVALVTDSLAVVACRSGATSLPGAAAAPTNHTTKQENLAMKITKESLLQDAPELANALRQEGRDLAVTEQSHERDRIKNVLALKSAMPGHESVIEEMAFDGKTSVELAKARILDLEIANRATAAAVLQNGFKPNASVPAPAAGASIDPLNQGAKAPNPNAPLEERAKTGWEASAEIRNEFDSLESYTAYMRGVESGAVRGFSETNPIPRRK